MKTRIENLSPEALTELHDHLCGCVNATREMKIADATYVLETQPHWEDEELLANLERIS